MNNNNEDNGGEMNQSQQQRIVLCRMMTDGKKDVDQKLISILSSEIQKDGGSSLVRDLKDYVNIDSFLKRCSTKNSKLLSFLESYPTIFEVHRDSLPHIVYLISSDLFPESHSDQGELEEQELLRTNTYKEQLKERILCVIKKEKSKNERRKFGVDQFASSVSVLWLMKQCKSQIHHFLRMRGYYQKVYESCRDVHLIGSNGWYELVTNEFIDVVHDMKDCNHDNGRVFLQNEQNVDIEYLAKTLIDRVEEDGGTHISLSLLLHRCPNLRRILSGIDLMEIKSKNEGAFSSINIFAKDSEVYLQRKSIQQGRMEVDETGLFSVASSKWGNKFASLMAKHCRTTLLNDPRKSIAIDLTASVGGVTLPLAKSFRNVLACEIDEYRSVLCHRNMVKYGVHGRVKVINEDSVDFIPSIVQLCDDQTKVVIVDPPWGGKHYKAEKCTIQMGKWTMVDVVERISKYLSPTIIGFRMPISYNSIALVNSLVERHVKCDVLETKKAGPQLFIILSV